MTDYATAARPYASAVYKLASEKSSLPSWGDALELLSAVVQDDTMLGLLDNPALLRETKAEAMLKVVGDELDQHQQNLVRLMAENDRLKVLPEVARQYEALRAESEGKIDAEAISAFPLNEAQQTAIADALKARLGREVSLTTSTDESLIGGVVIKAGDTIIDGSMKARLNALALSLGR
jgi:F-type H+-transporting ATPase subunit delta